MPLALHPARSAPWLATAILAAVACDAAPADPPPSEDWPRTEACAGLDDWPRAWAELETAAVMRLDELRDDTIDCDERGKLGPSPPLVRRAALDCAARSHAMDMAEQDYLGRFDDDGASERERVEAAAYSPAEVVQHIAAGPRDAAELLDRTWMPRPVPCSDLANPALTEIGIGHVGDLDGDFGTLWVVVLASP